MTGPTTMDAEHHPHLTEADLTVAGPITRRTLKRSTEHASHPGDTLLASTGLGLRGG
jgi:hypothetical protein